MKISLWEVLIVGLQVIVFETVVYVGWRQVSGITVSPTWSIWLATILFNIIVAALGPLATATDWDMGFCGMPKKSFLLMLFILVILAAQAVSMLPHYGLATLLVSGAASISLVILALRKDWLGVFAK